MFWAGVFSVACSGDDARGAASPAIAEAGAGASTQAGSAGQLAGAPALAAGAAATPSAGKSAAPSAAAGQAAAGMGAAGSAPPVGSLSMGTCCQGGQCLCRGDAPAALTSDPGPHSVQSYDLTGVGCVYYPTGAPPPYAAVAIADGFGGSGGCDSVQTGKWGPLYASYGIVAMIIATGSGDQPSLRGHALGAAIAAFKAENEKSGSPLFGKLAGRYGTSGFSMGGTGSVVAAQADPTLLSNVAIMPLGDAAGSSSVPALIICGSNDGIAPCATYGAPVYASVDAKAPKMRVTVMGDHAGQPGAGAVSSGAYALAFQKVFLEGDERWRPLLVNAKSEETTIH